ncbi:plasma-membrane choline transporter [Hirsutella rhossiliensis]|uniref:Protein PNS1 n=1 Tax=Hirsutella rhossiliensis TaxID=111463 RepID=A0A9P8N5D2_9HYPO|nr:plasma-membrane choline transporter domain-containing protein [Hirsutella rhossiliensis]KAH0966059.1 plasma-membrane choline transporter domain-containing protein [Hirsutella rhossiliensis]
MGEADSYLGSGQPQYQQQPYGQPQQQYGQQQQQANYNYNGGNQQAWGNNQSYPQQPNYGAPPPYSVNPPQPNDDKYSFDEAFKLEKPKYNDVWAGVLFLLFVAGYVVVAVISIRGYRTTGAPGSGIYRGNNFSLNSNTLALFGCVLAVAFVFSWLYITVARLLPKQLIWITGILNLAWALGTAIFYLYKRYWSAGIVFLVFAVFMAFAFYTWIPRIPFSALMLKTSVNVSKRYGHVFLVSLLGGLVGIVLSGLFSVTLVSIYVRFEPSKNNPNCADGSCSQAKLIGLIAYATFTMFWISEWLKNTLHCTVAGVFGSWYFCVNNFPKRATRGALRRSLTYSFGSISLGSLLVAIIQFLRQLCSIARQQAADDGGIGGMVLSIVFCILQCLVGLLEWALEFLNRYAFVNCALYNKPYFKAASDTWRMIKDRGIDALVNECLIGPVFSFGAMFIGFACALLAYLFLLFTNPEYNSNGAFTPVVMAFAFLIGFQVCHVLTTPLSSGIDTIFVAAGWDPQVMIQDHPELYQEMVRVYPNVQQAIQVR